MSTQFEQPGSYPQPGLIGRTIRFAAGVGILYMVIPPVLQHNDLVIRSGWETPILGWLPGFFLAVYLLPIIVNRGFSVKWRHRSQVVLGLLAIGAVVTDIIFYHRLWGPPLGWLVILTIGFVFGFLGMSFLVAGLFATPG